MNKTIDQILDLPKLANQKLPKNTFNEVVDSSEKSIAGWVGTIFKVLALAFLLVSLYNIVNGAVDYMTNANASGLAKAGSVLSILVLLYAAFPLAQVVRSTGDSLAASKSNIVDFIFKDTVVALIKMVGHLTALIALFAAIIGVISFVLNENLYSEGLNMINNVGAVSAVPMELLGFALEMFGLSLPDFFEGFMSMSVSEYMISGGGWSWIGLIGVAAGFVQVVFILAQLYVSLAVYHFIYGLISTFVGWVKSPSIPIKTSTK